MSFSRKIPHWRRQIQFEHTRVIELLVKRWGMPKSEAIAAFKNACATFFREHRKTRKRFSDAEFRQAFYPLVHMHAMRLAAAPFEDSLEQEARQAGDKLASAVLNCSFESMGKASKRLEFSPPEDWLQWSRSFVRNEVLGILLLGAQESCQQRLVKMRVRDTEDVLNDAICRIASREQMWSTFQSAKNRVGYVVEVAKRCGLEAVRGQVSSEIRRIIALRELTFVIRSARENSPCPAKDRNRFLKREGYRQVYQNWHTSLSPAARKLADRIVAKGESPETLAQSESEYHQIQETLLSWGSSLETELSLREARTNRDEVEAVDPPKDFDEPDYQIERLAVHTAYAAIENPPDGRRLRPTLLLLTKWADEPAAKRRRNGEQSGIHSIRPLKQTSIAKLPIHNGAAAGNPRITIWKQQSIDLFRESLTKSLDILMDGRKLDSGFSPEVLGRTVRLMLTDRLVFCSRKEDGTGLRYRQAAILYWWTFGAFPYCDIGRDLEMECFFPQREPITRAEFDNRHRMVHRFAHEAASEWAGLMMLYFDESGTWSRRVADSEDALPAVVYEDIATLRRHIPPAAMADHDSLSESVRQYTAGEKSAVAVEGWS